MNPIPLLSVLLLCLSTSSCVATAQASPEPTAPSQSLRLTSYDSRQIVVHNRAESPQRPLAARDRPARHQYARNPRGDRHDHRNGHDRDDEAKRYQRDRGDERDKDTRDEPNKRDRSDRGDKANPGDDKATHDQGNKAVDQRIERRRDIRARHARHANQDKKDLTRRLQSKRPPPCTKSPATTAPLDTPNDRKARLIAERAQRRCEKRAKRSAKANPSTR